MENFVFCSPTKIIFGRKTENQVGEEARALGDKVLLHYGEGSIKRSGLYGRIKESLNTAGVDFVELGGVKPNPSLELVREGIELSRREDVTGILAVGGGSSIDSAKGIAVGVPYEGDVWDFYTATTEPGAALPIGTVLTIPAAGSEASPSSVVTDEATASKFYFGSELVRPVFSILNPELTFTLPPFQTTCGAADIMSHIMERYFTNTTAVEFTDRLCEATLKTIIRNVPIVLDDPENYDARAEIMWAGTIAHNDLLGTGREGDWASHGIEHELSAQYGVAHGAGLATVFPAWMRHVYKVNLQRFVQYAVKVWSVDYRAGEEEAVALEGIRRLKNFYDSIGLPTSLSSLGVKDDRYAMMTEKALRFGSLGGLKKLGKEDVMSIYRLAASA